MIDVNMYLNLLKKTFLRGLKICFGFLLVILLLEVAVRIYAPNNLLLLDSDILLQKNATIKRVNPEGEKIDKEVIEVKNDLGFRGDNPPIDFGRYLSIIAVGGSTTECFALTEGKTWTDRLSVRLKENFDKVWVNNAGLDGHSTFGHQILMKNYISKIKPKIALFLVGVNDLYLSEIRDFDRWGYSYVDKNENPQTNTLLNSCYVCSIAVNLYRSYTAGSFKIGHKQIDFYALRSKAQKSVVDYHENEVNYNILGTSDVSSSDLHALLERHKKKYIPPYADRLKNLVSVSKRSGIEPVFITQPAIYGDAVDDVTGADLSRMIIEGANGEAGEGLTGREKWEMLELYNDAARKVAKNSNILLIDLAEKMPKSSKYYYDYVHYTNEGAKLVGEIVYSDLCPYLEAIYQDDVVKQCGKL